MAIKRAKILTQEQFHRLLDIASRSEHPLRDEVAIRLSFQAGLRAGEIAHLDWWRNILTAVGEINPVLHITEDVGKRAVEREIPLHPDLIAALKRLRRHRPEDIYVFYALHNNIRPKVDAFDRKGKPIMDPITGIQKKIPDPDWEPGKVSSNAVVQWFRRLYKQVGYTGCTSHSGRRTAITEWMRNMGRFGNSPKDVQELAGHKRLETTASYIEPSKRQHELVNSWG